MPASLTWDSPANLTWDSPSLTWDSPTNNTPTYKAMPESNRISATLAAAITAINGANTNGVSTLGQGADGSYNQQQMQDVLGD